ncbi:MAG: hypothetical protein WDW38_003343 [Sanguina aurantia]
MSQFQVQSPMAKVPSFSVPPLNEQPLDPVARNDRSTADGSHLPSDILPGAAMTASPADLATLEAASAATAAASPLWPFETNASSPPSAHTDSRPPPPTVPQNEHVTWLPELVLTLGADNASETDLSSMAGGAETLGGSDTAREADHARQEVGGSLSGAVVGPEVAKRAYAQDMVGGSFDDRQRSRL